MLSGQIPVGQKVRPSLTVAAVRPRVKVKLVGSDTNISITH